MGKRILSEIKSGEINRESFPGHYKILIIDLMKFKI